MLKGFAVAALALIVPLAACDTRADAPADAAQRQDDGTIRLPADDSVRADDKAGAPDAGESGSAAPAGNNDQAPAREPEFREVTVRAGTVLPIELQTAIASDTSGVEDPVRARVRRAVVIDGLTVIPAGSALTGVVTTAKRSGRVKGRAEVGFGLSTLEVYDERHTIRTGRVLRRAPATKKQDAAKIAVPAAAGAIIGGIAGGKDDAAKGAAIGGAAGTGYVLATRGKEVRLPAGTNFNVKLLEPITVRVPARGN